MPGIFKTLSEGIRGTSMASFDYLSKKDRMALVHYVQSLGIIPTQDRKPAGNGSVVHGACFGRRNYSEQNTGKHGDGQTERRISALRRRSLSTGRIKARAPKFFDGCCMDPARAAQISCAIAVMANQAPGSLLQAFCSIRREMDFPSSSATLNASEWQELYAELLKRTKSQ